MKQYNHICLSEIVPELRKQSLCMPRIVGDSNAKIASTLYDEADFLDEYDSLNKDSDEEDTLLSLLQYYKFLITEPCTYEPFEEHKKQAYQYIYDTISKYYEMIK